MKKLVAIIVLCVSLGLTGCEDKDAQQYAAQLIAVLDSYQEQVDTKVTAEKDSYKELAAVYERAREQNIQATLEDERIERSRKLASEMAAADHLPRNTEILGSLHDYAAYDFGSTKDFLQIEADAQAQFLGDIEALEFESETIDDLRASLKQLAKPKGRLKRLSDAATFAQNTKEEFDKLICKDLDAALVALQTKQQGFEEELSSITDAQQKAEKRAEIEAAQRSIKTIQDKKNAKCSG